MSAAKISTTTSAPTTFSNPMSLAWVPLADLKALGRKTRTHSRDQIGKLAASIRTFGFSVPILIDDDNRVLAGHARLEAARHVGMDKAPVVVLSHLSADQKRAFIIAENKLAELAGWDRETLKIELEELSVLDLDFKMAVTGFDDAEIDAIVLGGAIDADRSDDTPRPPEQATSREGDLWIMGDHRLYCGDALHAESLSAVLAGETARAVFTDPPFNVRVDGHVTRSGSHGEFVMASGEMSDVEFTAFLGKVWDQISRALDPGGLAYLCMDWRHVHHVHEAAIEKDLEQLNLIVWDKTAGGMGSFYRSRHELIFLMRKKGGAHTNRVQLGRHGRDRANVWAYPGVSGGGQAKARTRELHPTVKPLALVKDALLDCTAKGDLVLDLFSGSGTTLLAAHHTGRRGRAIELDLKYCDVGVIRWQDFSGHEAQLAGTRETFREVRARRAANAMAV
ncbi:MAG: DNA methyltransferase [Hyphomonadaceae bacterium]